MRRDSHMRGKVAVVGCGGTTYSRAKQGERIASVAVVQGYAVAGGFTPATGCDFDLAESTTFTRDPGRAGHVYRCRGQTPAWIWRSATG